MGRDKGSSAESSSEGEASGRRRRLCRSKNAKLARENREKKKLYVQTLERRLDALKDDNKQLRRVLGQQAAYVQELQRDVRYLRAALGNRAPLAALLQRLAPPPLSALWPCDLPPLLDDFAELQPDEDHNYTSHLISDISNEPLEDVGICLHVSNKKMSLEFCSICNERAIKNHDFVDF